MIELKSHDPGDKSPEQTYAQLRPVLEKYRGMLTHYDKDGVHPGAVTVVLTGAGVGGLKDRLSREGERLAALDGSVNALGSRLDPSMTPQVSGDWIRLER